MTTGIAIRHYTGDQATALRPLLLDVYTEVYADAARTDPFASPDRFAEGLDHWTARPGWSCVIGYDNDQPVGYAYGAPLPPRSRWWGGLLTQVPADVIAETCARTYALSELMVREPWRKTGTARRLHDTLLAARTEQRATLLVDQDHPKVHALYQSWGWTTLGDLRPRLPDAPLFHAMLLGLPLRSCGDRGERVSVAFENRRSGEPHPRPSSSVRVASSCSVRRQPCQRAELPSLLSLRQPPARGRIGEQQPRAESWPISATHSHPGAARWGSSPVRRISPNGRGGRGFWCRGVSSHRPRGLYAAPRSDCHFACR